MVAQRRSRVRMRRETQGDVCCCIQFDATTKTARRVVTKRGRHKKTPHYQQRTVCDNAFCSLIYTCRSSVNKETRPDSSTVCSRLASNLGRPEVRIKHDCRSVEIDVHTVGHVPREAENQHRRVDGRVICATRTDARFHELRIPSLNTATACGETLLGGECQAPEGVACGNRMSGNNFLEAVDIYSEKPVSLVETFDKASTPI
eukprot:2290990-Pleurochrysis_carterae.AAC.1